MNLIELENQQRQNAAAFIALADANAAYIMTSDLLTDNFVKAFKYAKHMVAGGSYSSGESQIVYVQLKKLQRFFAN